MIDKNESSIMPSSAEANEQLTQLRIDLAEGFSGINTQLVTIHNNQQRMIDSIYGNGKEGLITKVAKADTRIALSAKMMFLLMASFLSLAGYVMKTALTT